MTEVGYHRHENTDPAALGRDQESGGVGLAVERQINGNPRPGLEGRQAGDGGRSEIRAQGMFRRTQEAPLGAQLFSQLGFHEGWAFIERRWRYPHMPFWTVAPDLSNRWG